MRKLYVYIVHDDFVKKFFYKLFAQKYAHNSAIYVRFLFEFDLYLRILYKMYLHKI